ncbi:MAG: WD40/YVTN/BNR-like repeat-containing protein [Phycisphaerae bacterium]
MPHRPKNATTRRDLLGTLLSAAGGVLAWPWLQRAGGQVGETSAAASIRPAGLPPGPAGTWSPVPWVSDSVRRHLGRHNLPDLGGEGGQWVRSIAFAPDGLTAIWGTDVGGLYRTLDGGLTWEPCNVGFFPRGTCGVCFDPRNANRIIAAGANSMAFDRHGLYLSTDRGASWRNVLPATYAGVHDFRTQIAFDPTSFDPTLGACRVAYWSRVGDDKPNYGPATNEPGLYRTDDAGETWRRLAGSAHLGEAHLAHHPARGLLFVAAPDGLWALPGDAQTAEAAEKRSDLRFTGLDCSPADPVRLVACTDDAVLYSTDAGRTWQPVDGVAALRRKAGRLLHVRLSPADTTRIGVFRQGPDWDWARYVSHDGGGTWHESQFEDALNFFPRNTRQPRFAWHPHDPNVVLASGGDWPCRSDDGGRTFRWSAGGVNNVYVPTSFQFCPHDPDVLFLPSQDYNGAVTADGGRTWRYTNVSGEGWGGFCYAAAAASRDELWAGLSRGGWGAPRHLMRSSDGGATWQEVPGVSWQAHGQSNFGYDAAFSSHADAAARFAGPWRSQDAGQTWQAMPGCHGVYAEADGILYGAAWDAEARRGWLVTSTDAGTTWHRLAETGQTLDCAFDAERDRLYVVAEKKLLLLDGARAAVKLRTSLTPRHLPLPDAPALWTNEFHGVAVDPRNPSVVYVARHSNVFCNQGAALRSEDAGRTWHNLTRSQPLARDRRDPAGLDGAREAMRVRVHPTTGEAWFTTGCFGVWKWQPEQH